MNLTDILSDKKTFADDIELMIGTEKVNLGQLRDLSANQQRQLSEKIAGADQREKQAAKTAMDAANLLNELTTAREKLVSQKTEAPTEDDFEKEEFWSPVRKRFIDRDKKIDEAVQKIDALTKAVTQTATIWAEDRWHGQFDKVSPKLKKVEAYKDWDYKRVRDYAAEHKILDDHGLPSIERAVSELTKENDIETVRKQAFEDGKKAAQQTARLNAMPKPSSATGGKGLSKGKSAVEEMGLEGLGDDVMADSDLMDQIAQLQSLDTLQ